MVGSRNIPGVGYLLLGVISSCARAATLAYQLLDLALATRFGLALRAPSRLAVTRAATAGVESSSSCVRVRDFVSNMALASSDELQPDSVAPGHVLFDQRSQSVNTGIRVASVGVA